MAPADELSLMAAQARASARACGRLRVLLQVSAETPFGSQVFAVGSLDALGAWWPDDGLELFTTPERYPEWSAEAWLPLGSRKPATVEYKFVIIRPDGCAVWEQGPNRQLPAGLQPKDGGEALDLGRTRFGEAPPTIPLELPTLAGSASRASLDVSWHITCANTLPGDTVVVVGGAESLGDWQVARGLRLVSSPVLFPAWCGSARLPPGTAAVLEWKVVLLRADGQAEWEAGDNRRLPLRATPAADSWFVQAAFGGGPADVAPRRLTLLSPRQRPRPSAISSDEENSSDPDADGARRQRTLADAAARGTGSSCVSMASTAASDAEDATAKAQGGSHAAAECRLSKGDSFVSTEVSSDCSALTSPASCGSPLPAPLRLWAGAHQVRKPGGRCEDAHFLGECALGVADGVGSMAGFARHGVDAAAYAAELMAGAARAAKRLGGGARASGAGPAEVARAALAAAEEGTEAYGASTALVVTFEDGVVGAANLGDSGFAVLRRTEPEGAWAVVARSSEQQHYWNCPFQFMRLPQSLRSRLQPGWKLDTVADCDSYEVAAQAGDLLLLYTDGLSDNLHEHEILEIVGRCALSSPEDLAEALATAASARSLDQQAAVPFSEACQRQGFAPHGGKPDDITVVAAWVAVGGPSWPPAAGGP